MLATRWQSGMALVWGKQWAKRSPWEKGWWSFQFSRGMDWVVQAATSMTIQGRKTIFLTSFEWIIILPPRIICAERPNGTELSRAAEGGVGWSEMLGGRLSLWLVLCQ